VNVRIGECRARRACLAHFLEARFVPPATFVLLKCA